MFVMCFPTFIDTSKFAVKPLPSAAALWLVSFLALSANIAMLITHIYNIIKLKRNSLKEDIYTELAVIKPFTPRDRMKGG